MLLDNPGWYALNSHHRHLAILGNDAARYQPDIFDLGATPHNSAEEFESLRSLVEIDEIVYVGGSLPGTLSGWEVIRQNQLPQMVCDELRHSTYVDAVRLNTDDVPEMIELVALTQPGPFLSRTIELGQYIGIRQEGKLVAMAGEREHLMGFCEISAVCTDPEYRGRGYASALTSMIAEAIFERQEVPYLHVDSTNKIAIKIYERLGFRLRTHIPVARIKRVV